jgi:hypothetical protein
MRTGEGPTMTTTKVLMEGPLPRRPSDGIDGGGLTDGPDALPCGHKGPADDHGHCRRCADETLLQQAG